MKDDEMPDHWDEMPDYWVRKPKSADSGGG